MPEKLTFKRKCLRFPCLILITLGLCKSNRVLLCSACFKKLLKTERVDLFVKGVTGKNNHSKRNYTTETRQRDEIKLSTDHTLLS